MAGKIAGRCSRTVHSIVLSCGMIAANLIWFTGGLDAQQPQRQTRQPVRQAKATSQTGKEAGAKSKIVAVVNRQTITRDQLANECIRRFGKKVLESEVNKHLILQACQKKGIKITNGDINAEINRMAKKLSLPVDRWLEMLQQERDITVNEYKRDIVWPTLALRRLAAGQTEVTEKEIQRAFQSQYGPAVQVRLIVARSKSKAQKLHAAATRNPDSFDRLAKDESEDENSAATRGLIPPIRRYAGDPKVEKAAFALQPGQVSSIVQAAGQYLIMKCERHIKAHELTAEQRQVAIAAIKEQLGDKKLRSAASGMFAKLQSKAEIVNVLNDKEKSRQNPGVAAIVNGRKISLQHLGDQCILRQGEMVLEGEINRALLKQALKRRSQTVDQADLKEEIRTAAISYGFTKDDGTADIDGWLSEVTKKGEVTVDTYVRDAVWPSAALKKLAGSRVKISEEDIKKGFAANYGERVEVLAIVLTSHRTANEVFDLARKNPSEKFFGELAHQYSSEPVSKANYGQVPPIRRFGGQPMVEDEAFKLKPGEISGVLAVADKFIILRCLGRTKPVVQSLETVKEELVKDIREKKTRIAMSREFDRLKSGSQIDNFLAGTTTSGKDSEVQKVSHESPTK